MIQQMQTVCPDCHGKGDIIREKVCFLTFILLVFVVICDSSFDYLFVSIVVLIKVVFDSLTVALRKLF